MLLILIVIISYAAGYSGSSRLHVWLWIAALLPISAVIAAFYQPATLEDLAAMTAATYPQTLIVHVVAYYVGVWRASKKAPA